MSPRPSLRGRVCIVLGASSGIGQAIADALRAEDARVIAYARRFADTALEALPAPGCAVTLSLDITARDQVVARFAELPAIDVLINAAGLGHFGSLLDTDVSTLETLLAVHVVGSFACYQAAAAKMCGRGPNHDHRHIVTIGSIAAERYLPGCAAYTAAKRAQAALSEALSEELRQHGIRVSHLAVGAVDTPLWAQSGATPSPAERARMMQPRDVADVVIDVLTRPGVAIDNLTVLPPGGVL